MLSGYLAQLPAWQEELMYNVLGAITSLPVIAVALFVGHRCFARGIKGLGLVPRSLVKDLAMAVLNLLAILSVFLAGIQLTLWVGRWLTGSDYQIERHKELTLLVEYPQWSLRFSIVLMAVFVAPLVEELLFRGLVQSALRSGLGRPWPAIFLASLMFAAVHQNPEHWPALFVLGVGMGYAYERSGSLLRPIFIHAMFNGLTILSQIVETAFIRLTGG
jgi:membrane protease YdiL (CAAX protease family)